MSAPDTELNDTLKRSMMRLKEVRESSGLTQKSFAEMFEIKPATYSRYESGDIKKLPLNAIKVICQKYSLNPSWLMGYEEVEKYAIPEKMFQEIKRIPVLGAFNPKLSIPAQENLIDYEYLAESFNVDFCIKAPDSSMSGSRVLRGDLVYISQKEEVKSGEIALLAVDNQVLLRRIYKIDGILILRAENNDYSEQIFGKREVKGISVIGKAVFFKSEAR